MRHLINLITESQLMENETWTDRDRILYNVTDEHTSDILRAMTELGASVDDIAKAAHAAGIPVDPLHTPLAQSIASVPGGIRKVMKNVADGSNWRISVDAIKNKAGIETVKPNAAEVLHPEEFRALTARLKAEGYTDIQKGQPVPDADDWHYARSTMKYGGMVAYSPSHKVTRFPTQGEYYGEPFNLSS